MPKASFHHRVSLCALLFALEASVLASGQNSDEISQQLSGIWGAELDFGPLVHGPLTIDGRTPNWHASIGGFDVALVQKQSAVYFTLPANAAKFRGRLGGGGKTISGHWTQPASLVLFNEYATPVQLSEISPRVWRGMVHPLQPHISFYVSIRRASDGSLSALIRNPEFG